MLSNEIAMAVNEFLEGHGMAYVLAIMLFGMFAITGAQNINLRNELERLRKRLQDQPQYRSCNSHPTEDSQQQAGQQ